MLPDFETAKSPRENKKGLGSLSPPCPSNMRLRMTCLAPPKIYSEPRWMPRALGRREELAAWRLGGFSLSRHKPMRCFCEFICRSESLSPSFATPKAGTRCDVARDHQKILDRLFAGTTV